MVNRFRFKMQREARPGSTAGHCIPIHFINLYAPGAAPTQPPQHKIHKKRQKYKYDRSCNLTETYTFHIPIKHKIIVSQ